MPKHEQAAEKYGEARVVNLLYNNMTLFEVLATAGGISNTNSSKRIKIIGVGG